MRRFIENKQGSHVGVVLSFVVFITFLIFLYSILQPTIRNQRDKQDLINFLKEELEGKLSDNLTSMTMKIIPQINKNCIKIKDGTEEIIDGEELLVRNSVSQILNYSISNKDIIINVGDSFDGFLKIYYGNIRTSLGETETGCTLISSSDYTIGLTRTEKYIFEEKIIETVELMEDLENYNSWKEELGFPSGNEFGFVFKYNNDSIIEMNKNAPSTSIYAEEIPIQYIDKEGGGINFGFITIRVW